MDIHHPAILHVRHLILNSISECTDSFAFRWAGGGIFGRVIDTYGTHYVAIPCSLGCTGFVFLISMCTRYYSLILVQGVGFGICAAGLFSCATTSVGQYFDKRKALALGIALSGSSTGKHLPPLVQLVKHL